MYADRAEISWFHRFANWLFKILFVLLLRLRVRGREHIVAQGPLVLVTNHTIFLDSPLTVALVRPDVFPMGKIELFQGPFRWVFVNYGVFPVRRGEPDLKALRTALNLLKAGRTVYIAPEGTRVKEGALQEAREGVALIAWLSGAIVQPAAIMGANRFWDCIKRLRRTPVEFVIGRPFRIRSERPKPTREELRLVTNEMMYRIAELVPPEMRGEYADLSKATTEYLAFLDSPAEPAPAEGKEVPM